MESTAKSSASTTPRSAFKISINQKINTRLKNDLKELEKVSIPKLPNKVNLNNANFQNNLKKNSSNSETSPRKFPSLKNENVSIEELRSRVHHGSLGVLPIRKSEDVEGMKFVMKGKNTLKKQEIFDNLYPDEDEGIDELNTSGSDENDFDANIHSNQNTPNSLIYDVQYQQKIPMNRQNFLEYFYSQPKPAILPSTGTSSTAKFAERPKPQKKQKIILKPLKRSTTQIDAISIDSTKTETELQQIDLEKQVKNLVDEAKRIANVKKITKKKKILDKKEIEREKTNISDEKKVVKGVEGLISAIKSGQLVSEQEQSNRKIQEILG